MPKSDRRLDDHWAYLLLTPEGVLAGAVPEIVRRLDRHGLTAISARLIRLDVATMTRIYDGERKWSIHNVGHPSVVFSWDMHRRLYDLAPACVILVTGQRDTYRRLSLAKGNTRPELADADSIRWLTENVVLNYVHTPDDPWSAHAELSWLLGGPDSADRMVAAAAGKCPAKLDVEFLVALLPVWSGRDATSFVAIGNRIRSRVVQRLATDCGGPLPELVGAVAVLRAERTALSAVTTSRERIAVGRAHDQELHTLLRVAAASREPALAAGLDALSALYSVDGPRDLSAVLGLAKHGVYFSPLERVMVESHSHSFRPSAELEVVYPSAER